MGSKRLPVSEVRRSLSHVTTPMIAHGMYLNVYGILALVISLLCTGVRHT